MMERLKQFFSSSLGWTATAVHFVAVVFCFWGRTSFEGDCGPFSTAAGTVYIAGTGLHWYYEPLLMKMLLIVDLPSLALAEILGSLIGISSWCFTPATWTLAAISLILASSQWYLLGKFVESLRQSD